MVHRRDRTNTAVAVLVRIVNLAGILPAANATRWRVRQRTRPHWVSLRHRRCVRLRMMGGRVPTPG